MKRTPALQTTTRYPVTCCGWGTELTFCIAWPRIRATCRGPSSMIQKNYRAKKDRKLETMEEDCSKTEGNDQKTGDIPASFVSGVSLFGKRIFLPAMMPWRGRMKLMVSPSHTESCTHANSPYRKSKRTGFRRWDRYLRGRGARGADSPGQGRGRLADCDSCVGGVGFRRSSPGSSLLSLFLCVLRWTVNPPPVLFEEKVKRRAGSTVMLSLHIYCLAPLSGCFSFSAKGRSLRVQSMLT